MTKRRNLARAGTVAAFAVAIAGTIGIGGSLVAATATSSACELSGPVRVIDGDSLEISRHKLRLHGIDAPERGEMCEGVAGAYPCGTAATEALRELAAAGPVVCRSTGTGRFGALIVRCAAAGADFGRAMVESGNAKAFGKFSSDYEGAEHSARAGGRGMWISDSGI